MSNYGGQHRRNRQQYTTGSETALLPPQCREFEPEERKP